MSERVLLLTTHIDPGLGFGGPAQSAVTLREVLLRRGGVEVFTLGTRPVGAPGHGDETTVESRSFFAHGFGFAPGYPAHVVRRLRRTDAVYLNGLGTFPTLVGGLLCVAMRMPFVCAPRGRFMPGLHGRSGRQLKQLRRRALLKLSSAVARRASVVHCASDMEATATTSITADSVPIVVAGNGARATMVREPDGGADRDAVVLYVGRFSEEKRVTELVRAWSLLGQRNGHRLILVGADDSAYSREVRTMVAERSDVVVVPYSTSAEVLSLTARARFLVLASGIGARGRVPHMENYGNVVADALVLGTPIVVSASLAWQDAVNRGAGLSAGDSIQELSDALAVAVSTAPERWSMMSRSAERFGRERCTPEVCLSGVVDALVGGMSRHRDP